MTLSDDFKQYRSSLKEGQFLPFTQHKDTPFPFPVFGVASESFADARKRAEAMLENEVYTKAWVVTRDEVTEINKR